MSCRLRIIRGVLQQWINASRSRVGLRPVSAHRATRSPLSAPSFPLVSSQFSHSLAALRYATDFRFYEWRRICAQWGPYGGTSIFRCSEWRHCVVLRGLSPLLRCIDCFVSETTSGAETRRFYRAVGAVGAGGGACNSRLPCLLFNYKYLVMLSNGRCRPYILVYNYKALQNSSSHKKTKRDF